MKEEKKNTTQTLKTDKTLALLIPGTEASDRVSKPKPPPEGVNQELVNSRFNLLHPKEESEKELLIRVKKQGEQILKNLMELKVRYDNIYLSNEGSDPKETNTGGRENLINCASTESRSETPKQASESELNCKHCALLFEEPNQLKESDKVYVNRLSGEVLIFPKDETHDEEWIQEHLINTEDLKNQKDKIFYAKSDALRLEQFLKLEQEGALRMIKKKCIEYSKPCEGCLILSKWQKSNRENE